MAIGFVEMQGQITRAQDFMTVKHNEDTKGLVDQSIFGSMRETRRKTARRNSTQRKKGVTSIAETAAGTGRKRRRSLTAKCC